MFDKLVLNAVAGYFDLLIRFDYGDSVSFAKQELTQLKNRRLKTVTKDFELPSCLPDFETFRPAIA